MVPLETAAVDHGTDTIKLTKDSNVWLHSKDDENVSVDDCESDDLDDGTTTVGNGDPHFDNATTKHDSQRVVLTRILLIITLVTSATIIAILLHRYIASNEKRNFEDKFNNDASKVLEAIGSSLERTLGVLDAISISFVSFANTMVKVDSSNNDTIRTWPFVTLPDFALHASKLLPLTDGVYVSIQPIVYPSQKLQWEEYASQNDQWVNETLDIQEVWDGFHGNTTLNWMKNRYIYNAFGDIESNVRYVFQDKSAKQSCNVISLINIIHSRYMLPQWQGFPIALEVRNNL